MNGLTMEMPDDVIEQIAQRAAEIVVERQPEPDGFLDVPGAAEYLACKQSRIYAMKSAGRLPFHKDGTRLLFLRAELRAYVAAGGAVRP